MRSSGSLIGGAINFSTNYDRASAGGIAVSTYLIFVAFGEYSALILLSKSNSLQNALEYFGRCRSLRPRMSVVGTAAKSPCLAMCLGNTNLLRCGTTIN